MDKEQAPDYVIQQRARLLSVVSIVVAIIQWRRRRRLRYRRLPIKYGPLVSRDLVRQTRLDELYNGTDKNCIRQLRMRKAIFWKLSSRLRDSGLLRDTIHVSVEEQLAMFLHTKYATTYTVEQVHRHWRRHKDTWGLVAKHINESGGGWDDETKMVTVSQSSLNELSSNDRGILTKPIQFFDKLQELFSGSTADGSFMQDHCTAAEPDQDGNAVVDIMGDMADYDKMDEPHGHDSDKLESDSDECQEVAALAATSSQISSSSVKSMKPNKRNFKRIGKPNTIPAARNGKANKSSGKQSSCVDDDMDVELTNTLKGIQQTLAKPVQVAPPPDPNSVLWDMLKNIALTPDDRLAVGMHLCKPQFQVHRTFLINMGQEYLERWVFKYLSGDDPCAD